MDNNLLLVCFDLRSVKKLFWGVLGLFIFCYHVVMAQQPNFRAITTDQDLPSNEVYSILQDAQGFIWIGCDAGLFRYNGVKFIPYKTAKQRSKSITGLSQTPNGRIYCHNFTGQVFYIENDQMHELECSEITYVSNITTNQQNEVWLATKEGLYYYSPQINKCVQYQNSSFSPKNISRNFTDKQDNIWFTSDDGVGRLDKQKKITIYPFPPQKIDLLGNLLICNTPQKTLLVGVTSANLYQITPQGIKSYYIPTLNKALEGKKVTNAYLDTKDRLWITTYTGVVMYHTITQQIKVYLEEFSFSDILIDKDESIWLTTLYDGILYIPNLDFEDLQAMHKVLKICHDEQNIYFGNTSGLLGVLNPHSQETKIYDAGLKADIRSLNYDSSDKAIYFNMNSSIYQLKDNNISLARSFAHSVKSMIHVPEGYLIASSIRTYFVKNLQDTSLQVINEQWGRNILYDTKNKYVWVATNKGLLKVIYQAGEYIVLEKLLQDKQILDICLWETQQQLFAVTFEGFIYQISPSLQIEPIAQLPNHIQAYHILCHNNQLYIGTNKGLFIYNLHTKDWQKIGKLEGLISDNLLSFTFFKDKIWIGTEKGVQSIPIAFKTKQNLSKIFLKKVLQNQIAIGDNDYQKIKMQPNDALKIYVEAVCYSSYDKFRYAYRINQKSSWNYLPANTEAIDINSLPAGAFSIEIMVEDHQGRFSKNLIVIKGEVLPPIWQRGWFLSILFFIILFSFFIGFKLRVRHLQKKQEQVLNQLHLENELNSWQQTALQVQMSPHFLFNILNSIKAYIYENDKQKAITYLNHFANLVRKILQNSNQKEALLIDELEIIKHYIELEGMLLEKDFSWEINIAENIATDEIYIPTLLIQPFVENAFKHGLRHKKGEKKLTISIISLSEQVIQLTVDDNGIGRKASQLINQKNKPLHQSFAMQNIKKRIDLLNQNSNFDIQMQILDKENPLQEALGTQIVLTIKYHE
ncbi:hypothetical protein AD998_13415 [bacterium 336/3]|nr:hypothetical protein AD998_13415 [bacterium 336/3]